MEDIILVTGGSGLIGSAIQEVVEENKTKEKWIFVSSKDADLRDEAQAKALFEKYSPTHVIHLAASVGGLFRQQKANCDIYRSNIRIDVNVLECCHLFGVKKVISCLPTSAYPEKTTYPFDETMLHNGPPHECCFGYAHAKRMIDVLNKAFCQDYGRMYTSVIASNVFGPNDEYSVEGGHAIPGIINNAYKAKLQGTDLIIYGSGRPLRQYIYSKDLARLILWALRSYEETEPIIFTVGQTEEISITDVANIIVDCVGFKGMVIYDTSKSDGQFRKTASNAKLRKYLPEFKFTPLEKAIKETCDWFVHNIDKARR